VEYSEEGLDHARAAVERLSTAVQALDAYSEERPDDTALEEVLSRARDAFRRGLDDDLNVSEALAATFDLVRDLNRRMDERALSTADARRAAGALRDLDSVFAVLDLAETLPSGAQQLLDQRAAAREARDWASSDRLRDELATLGVIVEDTRDGQRWRVSGAVDV
jgi:cysteinyl-tRNA synthetase